MPEFNTFIYCDETKFYLKKNDLEEAIYYLGVSIKKHQLLKIKEGLLKIFTKHRIKANIYHSTNIFRRTRPRIELMNDLTDFIIYNKLQCFCHRYGKNDLFEKTKLLKRFNNEIIDFNKVEFQALFFFMTSLNIYLIVKPNTLKKDVRMYFDRMYMV